MLFLRHTHRAPLPPTRRAPQGRPPIRSIARPSGLLLLLSSAVVADRWRRDARASVAASAESGGGGRGRRGGGRGLGGRKGRGGGKSGSPPLDLATADVAAAALSVDPALILVAAAARRNGDDDEEEEDREQQQQEAGAATDASSSPRLPDALHAALPDRFPTLSAARRAIRKGAILVAASGADDGAFESVAPPDALRDKAAAFCSAAAAVDAPLPAALIVGNCGTRVLGPGVWIVALEPGAEVAAAAGGGASGRRAAVLGVAHEDDLLAVVVKPWGVLMSGGDPLRTVSAALARMVAAAATDESADAQSGGGDGSSSGGPPKLTPSTRADALPRPQAAHRLDAAVGGLVAVGKTASALAEMSRAFRERRVRKRYRALLRGRLEPGEAVRRGLAAVVDDDDGAGEATTATPPPAPAAAATADVEAALDEAFLSPVVGAGAKPKGNNNNNNNRPVVLSVCLPLDGKPCETRLAVAGYSRCPRYGGWLTTVDLEPVTGRQHQLRRHCATLGHAIVGDGRYRGERASGRGEEREQEEEEGESPDGRHIGGQGLFLESVALGFDRHPGFPEEEEASQDDDPRSREPLMVEQAEPRRFVTLRAQQRSAWAKAQRVKAREVMMVAAAAEEGAEAEG